MFAKSNVMICLRPTYVIDKHFFQSKKADSLSDSEGEIIGEQMFSVVHSKTDSKIIFMRPKRSHQVVCSSAN